MFPFYRSPGRMHKGRTWEVALGTGHALTVFTNASMLFPNPFFTPVVQHAHMIELLTSNLLGHPACPAADLPAQFPPAANAAAPGGGVINARSYRSQRRLRRLRPRAGVSPRPQTG